MQEAEAYRKACDIADALRDRGYPVRSSESVSNMIIIRFGGGRPQTVHADADDCSLESFQNAYARSPP